MAKFDQLCQLANVYSRIADFLVIYIEEAHPSNGWSFRNNYVVTSHKTVSDRINAARLLLKIKPRASNVLTLVVDDIDDNANKAYGGLFERIYIVHNSTIVYQGPRGPNGFHLDHVDKWLHQCCNV